MSDLAENLRLLVSFGRSVTDVCRRAGINRQQFNRYLAGAAAPSLQTLRRLGDFFGVEEHELLLDAPAFRNLIRLRPPRLGQPQNTLAAFFAGYEQSPEDRAQAKRLVGYYHSYIQPERQVPLIYRLITRVSLADQGLDIRTLGLYRDGLPGLPNRLRYGGVGFVSANRLLVMQRERQVGKATSFAMLYLSEFDRSTYLPGVLLGVEPDAGNDIVAIRTLWQFLGDTIDLRAALKRCGRFEEDKIDLDPAMRRSIVNDLMESEPAFGPRH